MSSTIVRVYTGAGNYTLSRNPLSPSRGSVPLIILQLLGFLFLHLVLCTLLLPDQISRYESTGPRA